jgi:hypothetical protein
LGPKREDYEEGGEKLHNDVRCNNVQLRNSEAYYFRVQAEHRACMAQTRNTYRILVGKPERKGSLERPKHKW